MGIGTVMRTSEQIAEHASGVTGGATAIISCSIAEHTTATIARVAEHAATCITVAGAV